MDIEIDDVVKEGDPKFKKTLEQKVEEVFLQFWIRND